MRRDSEDFIGTCQCCFGEYKVSPESRKIVLHGYMRPGIGYTVGNCVGTNAPPFEYETSLTRRRLADLEKTREREKRRLHEILDGTIVALSFENGRFDRLQGKFISEILVTTPGDPNWNRIRKSKICETESRIRHLDLTIAYVAERLAGWQRRDIVGIDVPATGRKRVLADGFDAAEHELRIRREADRAARDAKPGKLRIVFHWRAGDRGAVDWDIPAGERERIRKWATTMFPNGPVRVGVGMYPFDVPRAQRVREADEDVYRVVIVNVDWRHRDGIGDMLPGALRTDTGRKKTEYAFDATAWRPWEDLEPAIVETNAPRP